MKKIDVILPTFNQAEFIEKALESILKQTFQDFQLIIVNDGSEDKTKEKLSSIKNPQITILHNEKNQGLPATLNIGHAAGNSPYCTWISTDNTCNPVYLERLYDHISKNSECDLVQGSWHYNKNGKKQKINTKDWKNKFWGIGNLGPVFLYKRKVWETCNYDVDYYGCEDLKFYVDVSLFPFNIQFLESEDALIEYYNQKNSISGRNIPLEKKFNRLEEEVIFPAIGKRKRRLG